MKEPRRLYSLQQPASCFQPEFRSLFSALPVPAYTEGLHQCLRKHFFPAEALRFHLYQLAKEQTAARTLFRQVPFHRLPYNQSIEKQAHG